MLSDIMPLRSIDPEDQDFSDLMPLAEAIGDARVVGLGEALHADGHAYMARARLAMFLHREMGFEVLAWESGITGCRAMDRWLRQPESEGPPVEGAYGMWRLSEELQPLFEYARASHRSGHPLEMAGFDCRTTEREHESYHRALFEFVDSVDPSFVDVGTRACVCDLVEHVDIFDPPYDPKPEERLASRAAVEAVIETLILKRTLFIEKHGQRELAFWHQVLRSLLDLERMRAIDPVIEGGPKLLAQAVASTNVRDASMAETLLWMLDDYYADRKIMLWAASFHLCANHIELELGPDIPGFAKKWPPEFQLDGGFEDLRYQYPMGEYLRRRLGDDYYSIGCTTYAGQRGQFFEPPMAIEPAAEGSVEAAFHDTGLPFGLLDLRGLPSDHQLRSPVVGRALGHGQQSAVWPRHLDALCFVDEGQPGTRVAMTDS